MATGLPAEAKPILDDLKNEGIIEDWEQNDDGEIHCFTVNKQYFETVQGEETKMKRYLVMREHRAEWNTVFDIDNDAEWIVDDVEIERLSNEWGTDKAALMEQVQEV